MLSLAKLKRLRYGKDNVVEATSAASTTAWICSRDVGKVCFCRYREFLGRHQKCWSLNVPMLAAARTSGRLLGTGNWGVSKYSTRTRRTHEPYMPQYVWPNHGRSRNTGRRFGIAFGRLNCRASSLAVNDDARNAMWQMRYLSCYQKRGKPGAYPLLRFWESRDWSAYKVTPSPTPPNPSPDAPFDIGLLWLARLQSMPVGDRQIVVFLYTRVTRETKPDLPSLFPGTLIAGTLLSPWLLVQFVAAQASKVAAISAAVCATGQGKRSHKSVTPQTLPCCWYRFV